MAGSASPGSTTCTSGSSVRAAATRTSATLIGTVNASRASLSTARQGLGPRKQAPQRWPPASSVPKGRSSRSEPSAHELRETGDPLADIDKAALVQGLGDLLLL